MSRYGEEKEEKIEERRKKKEEEEEEVVSLSIKLNKKCCCFLRWGEKQKVAWPKVRKRENRLCSSRTLPP